MKFEFIQIERLYCDGLNATHGFGVNSLELNLEGFSDSGRLKTYNTLD